MQKIKIKDKDPEVEFIDLDLLIWVTIDEYVKKWAKISVKISNNFQKIAVQCDNILSIEEVKEVLFGKDFNPDSKLEMQMLRAYLFGLISDENSFRMNN